MSPRRLWFSTINLGCSKNMVDTQNLLGRMLRLGQNNLTWDVQYCADPDDEEVTIVFINTCGFLRSGRQEMLEVVKTYVDRGIIVYVMGCGAEYFEATRRTIDESLLKEEDDDYQERKRLLQSGKMFLLSRKDMEKVNLYDIARGYSSVLFDGFAFVANPRAFTNAHLGYEYCKIAEGCNNSCSFCIIPKIRGKQRSRPISEIIDDIRQMRAAQIPEIILLAQDTTRYGVDLLHRPMLFDLLDEIEALDDEFRLRLLYMYPDVLTLNHLRQLQGFRKLLPYFDIPLQHISSPVLKRMGRFYDEEYLYAFLDEIARLFPTRYMRTNYIIGFPGETEADFIKLCDWVQKDVFDSIALFEYHDELLAPSSKLDQKVPDEEIHRRFLHIKGIWDSLATAREKRRHGQQCTGIVTDIDTRRQMLTVRPLLHAPDIDPVDHVPFRSVVGWREKKASIETGVEVSYVVGSL
ncbi:MAG: MiaB/RimO family radical SAM methylthiotransferase [Candidatus Absconditabacterales bacterium]|nr:MiaB/RimO family radical SAM methylthiotransferase [Candidatus Absconditabacterales bacterium]